MSKLGPYFGEEGPNPAPGELLELWVPFGSLEKLPTLLLNWDQAQKAPKRFLWKPPTLLINWDQTQKAPKRF